MIAIIDYGMGNLKSVAKAVERLGEKVVITSKPKEFRRAEKIILPGVGSFSAAVDKLNEFGLISVIKKEVFLGKPFLGICLGLQLLFLESEESPGKAGLGILPGKVKLFKATRKLKVPHMGWNKVKFNKPLSGARKNIFKGVPDNSYFYFCHSYYAIPTNKSYIGASTTYGIKFTSVIAKDNIFAIQFHPEKSQKFGLKILENFIKL